MNKKEAVTIIKNTFNSGFNEESFKVFVSNLFKEYEVIEKVREGQYIKDSFKSFILKYKVIGSYKDSEDNTIDILEVALNKSSSLELARTAQRNFIADYLKTNGKGAALVAFVSPKNDDWRLSLVRLEHTLEVVDEKLKTKEEITPAKRWSFLVGKSEGSHTAQSRFTDLLAHDEKPNLTELELAFDIEKVTKEFFDKYTELYFQLKEHLDELLQKDERVKKDFAEKEITTVDFAKKTLGQIVFLYFLQKKGWFGVAPDKNWGDGPKKFIRALFSKRDDYGKNFFNDVLEPLFYEALAQDRGKESIYPRLNNCRMPFLNGGLFEPMNGYHWETTDIIIPDELFSNSNKTKEDDIGDGILDIFDRYNFTVNENEPLEKEVAVDPEMLGKVFENLLDIKDRKSKGAFYTPREIVHYMCQESLINYLVNETSGDIPKNDIETFIRKGDRIIENDKVAFEKIKERENVGREYSGTYKLLLPSSVVDNADKLDQLLKDIKVADPAVGSGAFPLGMINEIVRARKVLNIYNSKILSDYDLKLHTISHSIYGVDIDPGAVEIAKLRLWLALVVEEKEPHPLPNLEHKIMQGNSLVSEYEGIKLFDKEILNEHLPHELTQTNLGIEGIERTPEQGSLGLGQSLSEHKMNELKIKIDAYIFESQRSKKETLKNEIDQLKWDLIELTLKEQNKEGKLNEVKKLRKRNIRPFFIWELEFSDVFINKGGFDVVVGNPPYVSAWSINKNEKDYYSKNFSSATGHYDLYVLFIEKALKLLHKDATLAYITSNKFLSQKYGLGLRELLLDNSMQEIINFGFNVFENATVETLILIVQKKEPEEQKINILDVTSEDIDFVTSPRNVVEQNFFQTLENKNFRINLTNNILNLIKKIDKNSYKIQDLCYVSKGAEIHTTSGQGKGDFIHDRNDGNYKKYIEGKWFNRYTIDKFVYLDYQPEVHKAPIFPEFFEAKKLLVKNVIGKTGIQATYDDQFLYNNDAVNNCISYHSLRNVSDQYSQLKNISEEKFNLSKEYDIKYILSIINSKLMTWYFDELLGFGLHFYPSHLRALPIKKVSSVVQQGFIDLVNERLRISNSDHNNKEAKKIELENKLNESVMDLYELNQEEKEIIRNS